MKASLYGRFSEKIGGTIGCRKVACNVRAHALNHSGTWQATSLRLRRLFI